MIIHDQPLKSHHLPIGFSAPRCFRRPVGSVTLTPAGRQALQVLVPFCAASQEESRA
jgi:hypothetical protein